MCNGWISNSCSNNDTRPVTLVTQPVKSIAEDNGTYQLSFVTLVYYSGYLSHGGDCKTFKVMTSTEPIGIFGLVLTVLTAAMIYSISRWCWNFAKYQLKIHNWKIVSF